MPFRSFFVLAAAGALATGCAAGSTADDADLASAALGEDTAQLASRVVVADPRATSAAVVGESEIRIPRAEAERLAVLTAGDVLVGARGPSGSKNPDGFLRRVVSVTEDGGSLVIATAPAKITDAVVTGDVRTSATGVSLDEDGPSVSELSANAGRAVGAIDLDLDGEILFENVDEVQGKDGVVRFTEKIVLDRGKLAARPDVDVDMRIKDGKVSRFVARVEGTLDAEVLATATVEADGPVDDAALAALRARRHQVRKVLYTSRRIPLPTISVGRVPVSPSVQMGVALVCDLSFGGPHVARAGVLARSAVRLAAVYDKGAWQPPVASAFAVRPSLAIGKAGEASVKCAIEASAELAAYGVGGVTMSVAPWVSFDVTRSGAVYSYRAEAGATGKMSGRADVFGVRPEDLERTLVDWTSDTPVTGTAP